MKKSLKRNKKMRKNKSRRARYSRKHGGMFSRIATGVARRMEPRVQKKAEEWTGDILEAKVKSTDAYKGIENKANESFKDLQFKLSSINNENIGPNNYSQMIKNSPILKNAPINVYKSFYPYSNISNSNISNSNI
jgi:hypothetical protein